MNHRPLLKCSALLVVLLLCAGRTPALAGGSDKSGEEIADTPKDRHAIGKDIRLFKPLRGRYQQTIKWWANPGAKPTEDKAMTAPDWILDGLFQRHEVKGQWLGIDFEGQATIGHDNGTGEYVLSWIDSFHSGIFHARGKYDKSTDTITFQGSYFDVVNEQDLSIKIVATFVGKKGDMNIEVFDVSASSEPVKFMEIESKKFIPAGA